MSTASIDRKTILKETLCEFLVGKTVQLITERS